MLGRPLGVPGDAAFQERVLLAALRLLEAPSGPVLADYPEDAPRSSADDATGQACPVGFAREVDEHDVGAVFLREIEELAPWHDLARERRGRSAVGLSGEPVEKSASMLAAFLKGEVVPHRETLSPGEALKLACEDVRSYYYEAAAARPGNPDATAIQSWFWTETAAGRAFLALRERCLLAEDKSLQRLAATSIVPTAVLRSQAKA